jgi:hypothetical protein
VLASAAENCEALHPPINRTSGCAVCYRPNEQSTRPTLHCPKPVAMPANISQWLNEGCLSTVIEGALGGLSLLLESSLLRVSHDIDFGLVDISKLKQLNADGHSALQSWQSLCPPKAVRFSHAPSAPSTSANADSRHLHPSISCSWVHLSICW